MTNMVLHLWLLAASAASAPGTSLTPPPLIPTVEGPAAPSPAPPPLPTLPGIPGSAAGSGTGTASGRARTPEASLDDGQKAGTQKRDAKSDGSARPGGDKNARTPGKRPAKPVLPTLTPTALKGELRQSLAKPGEAPVPVTDRARLEQLASEIAHAREALRQETARLEALIKQSGPCEGEGRSSSSEGSSSAAAAAAKDMAREQLESVSKALKGMKPEQAAAVLSLLDRRLAAQVLRRMRPADAGAVMGYLKPEQAAELATEIATRKPTAGKKGAP